MQLRKQQRNLVDSFRSHQVDDLRQDEEKDTEVVPEEDSEMLVTGIQADFEQRGDLLAGIDLDKLDEDHRNELHNLVNTMKKEEGDAIDALIMYEITGYQGSAIQDWSDYQNESHDDDVGDGEGGGQATLSDKLLAAGAPNNGSPSSPYNQSVSSSNSSASDQA